MRRFGGVVAVDRVSFDLEAGVVLGIIGPNGSGKTTLLNLLNGVYPPDAGEVWLAGRRVEGGPPQRLADLGVMRTFQTTRVFRSLTVLQNMLVPLLHRPTRMHEARNRAIELLASVGLAEYAHVPASQLSGGQQRLLEFVRALMTEPRVVLMDEPFAGVHPDAIEVLTRRVEALRKEGASFVVVSHEIPVLMSLSQRVLCLNQGRVIADGTPEEVARNEAVVEAYLGDGRVREVS
ncbi:MAG: ABC transporter ATP-binding protein [Armatimonadota bacterium]|nr:ABC transporter ATP-binding protein [Armatimonadota bacterium]MDR7561948.1 ABC transporter ATP-binding protein [Armatimonadota bacterium]MDR7568048.1 ABC transporter ATP-binding protein [Armatimonadota bacterium]